MAISAARRSRIASRSASTASVSSRNNDIHITGTLSYAHSFTVPHEGDLDDPSHDEDVAGGAAGFVRAELGGRGRGQEGGSSSPETLVAGVVGNDGKADGQ